MQLCLLKIFKGRTCFRSRSADRVNRPRNRTSRQAQMIGRWTGIPYSSDKVVTLASCHRLWIHHARPHLCRVYLLGHSQTAGVNIIWLLCCSALPLAAALVFAHCLAMTDAERGLLKWDCKYARVGVKLLETKTKTKSTPTLENSSIKMAKTTTNCNQLAPDCPLHKGMRVQLPTRWQWVRQMPKGLLEKRIRNKISNVG